MDRERAAHLGCARWESGRCCASGIRPPGKMNHPAPEGEHGPGVRQAEQEGHRGAVRGTAGKVAGGPGGHRREGADDDAHRQLGGGSQNWTPGFREEFQKRYGYDLLPYLPILTGRAVESREVSERFLWDLRRMVADLLLENYAGHMQEISHQHGLTLSIEAYGGGPLDEVAYGGRADVPMSEFWMGQDDRFTWNKEMASSGHVYGRPVIAAESFTAVPG